MRRRLAVIAGVSGGLASAGLFQFAGTIVGGFSARLLGAGLLGFLIGLMIVVVETVRRGAYLEIVDRSGEIRRVNLGRACITVGSASENDVRLGEVPPVALRYRSDDSSLVCEEVSRGRIQRVTSGDTRTVGEARIVVRDA